jgi:hypothetical protein
MKKNKLNEYPGLSVKDANIFIKNFNVIQNIENALFCAISFEMQSLNE